MLRQISPVQPPHPMSWRSILILSSHLLLDLPSGLFPLGFHIKTKYASLFSLHTYSMSSHLILIDVITRIMFGEEYRSWGSSWCILFYSLSLFLSKVQIPSSAPCSLTYPSPFWETKIHTHTNQVRVKVNFTLEQAWKAQRGSRGIALIFL